MFANIRKHQKWLWFLISGAVIISFVWYFNPNSRNGATSVFGADPTVGTMNGRSITRSELMEARREASMLYFFTRGSWPGSDEFSRGAEESIEQEAKNRIFLKQKAKDLKIDATPAEVANWMAEFFGTHDKPFTEADYDRLVKQMLAPKGITEGDLNKFARGQVAIMHLASVAGAAGRLVTPQEAEAEYRSENEQVATEAVFFAATNYIDKVKLDPAALLTFYTNNVANYIEQPKMILTYVGFDATNYLAEADKKLSAVTNLSQKIAEMYQQRGTNFYTDTNGMVMTPDAAKAKILQDERHGLALLEARKAANEFAEELFNLPGGKQVANLETLAASKGLKVRTTEPFSQYEGPKGLDLPERFGQLASNLSPGEPFIEEPVVGPEGVYVMALKGQIERRIPKFEEKKDQVTEDYKRQQSSTLAQMNGIAFQSKLTNAMAAGKTFAAAATELGEKPVTIAPFSQASRTIPGLDPRVNISQLKNVAFALKAGETSGFTRSADGGFVLHVSKYIPAADDAVKNALPDFITQMQRTGQGEAFSEWFSKQVAAANIKLVTDRKPGTPGAAGQEAQ